MSRRCECEWLSVSIWALRWTVTCPGDSAFAQCQLGSAPAPRDPKEGSAVYIMDIFIDKSKRVLDVLMTGRGKNVGDGILVNIIPMVTTVTVHKTPFLTHFSMKKWTTNDEESKLGIYMVDFRINLLQIHKERSRFRRPLLSQGLSYLHVSLVRT